MTIDRQKAEAMSRANYTYPETGRHTYAYVRCQVSRKFRYFSTRAGAQHLSTIISCHYDQYGNYMHAECGSMMERKI